MFSDSMGFTHNHCAPPWLLHSRNHWRWHPKREHTPLDARIPLNLSVLSKLTRIPTAGLFRPRTHRIKGPFTLILGGYLKDPARSRSRRTPFSHIERLSDTLKGQFRFERPNGVYDYRDILLESSSGSSGQWRKVYTSPQYGTHSNYLQPQTTASG